MQSEGSEAVAGLRSGGWGGMAALRGRDQYAAARETAERVLATAGEGEGERAKRGSRNRETAGTALAAVEQGSRNRAAIRATVTAGEGEGERAKRGSREVVMLDLGTEKETILNRCPRAFPLFDSRLRTTLRSAQPQAHNLL